VRKNAGPTTPWSERGFAPSLSLTVQADIRLVDANRYDSIVENNAVALILGRHIRAVPIAATGDVGKTNA
jgi:hypothetical protein